MNYSYEFITIQSMQEQSLFFRTMGAGGLASPLMLDVGTHTHIRLYV